MALSVVKRPDNYWYDSTNADATYTNGSATLTKTGHGLSSGDHIYFNAGQYIGFWYVNKLTNDTFTISEYSGATAKTWYGAGTANFNYITASSLKWNAVELPIVYKLSSTAWPTNSIDTARTVSSFASDNGYTKLTLSGAIKSDITELEFIKITGNQAGIYQVLGFYSTSIITIDLVYNSNFTWAGSTVQYYYRNYHARIRVYGGLTASHTFAGAKPYELITEQRVTPDSSGIVTINIAEYLKKKIESLKNNLNLATLPNNIDAFCYFYITYAEAYDYSAGGYGLLDFVGSYTDDSGTFEGIAVNADLPFKNVYSGGLNAYAYGNSGNLASWLTPSLYPRLSVGSFMDISYLNTVGSNITVRREVLNASGQVQNVFIDSVSDYGLGVYRYQISQSIYLENTIKLTLRNSGTVISNTLSIEVESDCSPNSINLSWLNYLGGFDYWTFKAFFDYGVNINETRQTTKNILPSWPNSYGADADTIRSEILRASNQTILFRAERLTGAQVDDLYRIRTSPLVMIVNSRTDRRVIIPDAGSFIYHAQANRLFELTFTASLTDQLPVQSL